MTNVSELNATLSLLYNERTKGYDNNELISIIENKLKELLSGVTNVEFEEELYVVSFYSNYADEFDVESFSLIDSIEYKHFQNILEKIDFPEREFYFGTNESIILSSEEIKTSFNFTKITKPVRDTIINYIGSDFGLISPTRIIEACEYIIELNNKN